jgi:hypothetical protein
MFTLQILCMVISLRIMNYRLYNLVKTLNRVLVVQILDIMLHYVNCSMTHVQVVLSSNPCPNAVCPDYFCEVY